MKRKEKGRKEREKAGKAGDMKMGKGEKKVLEREDEEEEEEEEKKK